jgi:hypothetical protein
MMKKVSMALAAAGVLVAIYAVAGRFIGARTVLSYVVPNGMAAMSLLLGANTLLLLALLANAYSKGKE